MVAPCQLTTPLRVEPHRRDLGQEFAGTGRGPKYLTHGQLLRRPVLREDCYEQAESSAAESMMIPRRRGITPAVVTTAGERAQRNEPARRTQ